MVHNLTISTLSFKGKYYKEVCVGNNWQVIPCYSNEGDDRGSLWIVWMEWHANDGPDDGDDDGDERDGKYSTTILGVEFFICTSRRRVMGSKINGEEWWWPENNQRETSVEVLKGWIE